MNEIYYLQLIIFVVYIVKYIYLYRVFKIKTYVSYILGLLRGEMEICPPE